MKPFRFKTYQREDYARAALHNGLILAHDRGLGKSIAAYTLPLLWLGYGADRWPVPRGRVLFVAGENLHAQLIEEGREKFGAAIVKLDSQKTYWEIKKANHWQLPPGWYITSYTQLSSNKVAEMPDLEQVIHPGWLKEMMAFFGVTAKDVAMSPTKLEGVEVNVDTRTLWCCRKRKEEWSDGIGQVVNGIRCCYSPSLAELCSTEFDCVVVDEAVRIKGDTTLIGQGVRMMNPAYRLVLTGTPIKNRLPDIFHLAAWACGGHDEPTPRWPYSSEAGEKDTFASEFLVCERNLSKERADNRGRPLPDRMRGGRWRRGKPTAEVCNIHRLWKLLAPVVLRRRKQDVGEAIVMKQRHPIRVPMGKQQAEVYAYHLKAHYRDRNGNLAHGAKLQALRSCAVAPHSPLLGPVNNTYGAHRSKTDYIPKLAATLTVIEKVIRAGDQVVVFSSFHEPLDTLGRRLTEAGVPFLLMDGRKSAKLRGKLSKQFQAGRPTSPAVALAGKAAMGEGNNWWRCSNVINLDYDWALDLNEQAEDRAHRLTSVKDVNVYDLICQGSVDLKLESMRAEKSDSSELVLDGALMDEAVKEISLAELLEIAAADFAHAETLDETQLEREWPALRARLGDALHQTRPIINGGIRLVPIAAFVLPATFPLRVPVLSVSRFGKSTAVCASV